MTSHAPPADWSERADRAIVALHTILRRHGISDAEDDACAEAALRRPADSSTAPEAHGDAP